MFARISMMEPFPDRSTFTRDKSLESTLKTSLWSWRWLISWWVPKLLIALLCSPKEETTDLCFYGGHYVKQHCSRLECHTPVQIVPLKGGGNDSSSVWTFFYLQLEDTLASFCFSLSFCNVWEMLNTSSECN